MGVYSRLVKSNELNAKKRFGQHFLRDTGVIDRIVRSIQPAPGDVFIEIGAGDGALSSRIAPGVARLLAVEIDFECIPRLEEALSPFQSALVIPGDILHLDLGELTAKHLEPGQSLRIAGNLPYNIATAVIEKLLHAGLLVMDMLFMVQLEVAQRIAACPGTRQYGFLSVHCQHHADVQLGFKISPACFVPRPQIVSSTLSFRPKHTPMDPDYEQAFEAVGKAAFGHRRKTLSNSLAMDKVLGNISHDLLTRAGIEGSRRAEELTVLEYEQLARVYQDEFCH